MQVRILPTLLARLTSPPAVRARTACGGQARCMRRIHAAGADNTLRRTAEAARDFFNLAGTHTERREPVPPDNAPLLRYAACNCRDGLAGRVSMLLRLTVRPARRWSADRRGLSVCIHIGPTRTWVVLTFLSRSTRVVLAKNSNPGSHKTPHSFKSYPPQPSK